MTAFSIPTFAAGYYASNENGNNTPPDAIESITVSTENVNLPANSSASGIPALTPDGNLTSIDDILQSAASVSTEDSLENKQFITVQSKSGNTFYIVIDRSGDTENVYFLNLVDEADLMALMGDDAEQADTTLSLIHILCVCLRRNHRAERQADNDRRKAYRLYVLYVRCASGKAAEPLSAHGADAPLSLIHIFIDSRYRSRRPMIITTNLKLAELKNPPDLAHARIYDRILERCAPILFDGKNFREENAGATRQTAKDIVNSKHD